MAEYAQSFTQVLGTLLQQIPYFFPFLQFPRETEHCNTPAGPRGKAMRRIGSASGLTFAYPALLNPWADLGKMIKCQKNYCSDNEPVNLSGNEESSTDANWVGRMLIWGLKSQPTFRVSENPSVVPEPYKQLIPSVICFILTGSVFQSHENSLAELNPTWSLYVAARRAMWALSCGAVSIQPPWLSTGPSQRWKWRH